MCLISDGICDFSEPPAPRRRCNLSSSVMVTNVSLCSSMHWMIFVNTPYAMHSDPFSESVKALITVKTLVSILTNCAAAEEMDVDEG